MMRKYATWTNQLHRYIDSFRHQSKMSSSKKFTWTGTLRQMLIRVYSLKIQSVMLVLYCRPSFVNCCPYNLLYGSTLPPPFPVWIIILYTRIPCARGGEYGVLGLRQINTFRKIPFTGKIFRWRHFALPSMVLIFQRYAIRKNKHIHSMTSGLMLWVASPSRFILRM